MNYTSVQREHVLRSRSARADISTVCSTTYAVSTVCPKYHICCPRYPIKS